MSNKKTTYKIMWSRLSLWRTDEYDLGGRSQTRVFTLWPKWVWWWIRLWFVPDPYEHAERWLKKNGHWDDKDFYRAICWWYANKICWWYGNKSDPGELIRLNPRLLK